jgi:predicted nucleic acid-binding protein
VSVVYDAGALIAADRSDRTVWAEHRARLELGYLPVATAPVIAQVSRSGRQAQLRRFLRGCEVVPFEAGDGHAVGELVERSGIADVVDVHVVLTAHRRGAAVVASDPSDLAPVAGVLAPAPPVFQVGG